MKPYITVEGFAAVISSILALLISINQREFVLAALSLALLVAVYLDYVKLAALSKVVNKLEVERVSDRRVYLEGEEASMTLRVYNKSGAGIPFVYLKDELPPYVSSITPEEGATPLAPRSIAEVSYKVVFKAPGRYTFKNFELKIGGPLGFFYIEHELGFHYEVTVVPIHLRSGIQLSGLQRIIGLIAAGKSLGGLYNLATIREYREGDDVRKIVWRLIPIYRKPLVREDYGEVPPRVLMIIDVDESSWSMGEGLNTFAHIELRLARSLIEFLHGVSYVDFIVCSEYPKLVLGGGLRRDEVLYEVFSRVEPGKGCVEPLSSYTLLFPSLRSEITSYDVVILLANPLRIFGRLDDIQLLAAETGGRLMVVLPRFDYSRHIGEEFEKKLLDLASMVESLGLGLVFVDESFSFGGLTSAGG